MFAGHGEPGSLELRDQRGFLFPGELDERRAHLAPLRVVAEMRDDRLERRNHRVLLHDLARGADAGLQLVVDERGQAGGFVNLQANAVP